MLPRILPARGGHCFVVQIQVFYKRQEHFSAFLVTIQPPSCLPARFILNMRWKLDFKSSAFVFHNDVVVEGLLPLFLQVCSWVPVSVTGSGKRYWAAFYVPLIRIQGAAILNLARFS
jgi:hypothetical protein